jgi:hypothetical protein
MRRGPGERGLGRQRSRSLAAVLPGFAQDGLGMRLLAEIPRKQESVT